MSLRFEMGADIPSTYGKAIADIPRPKPKPKHPIQPPNKPKRKETNV